MNKQEENLLRMYIQSYLKWLYNQNYSFVEIFNTTQITNYFFKNIEKPYWFKCMYTLYPFECITSIYEYIDSYKGDADGYKELMPISVSVETSGNGEIEFSISTDSITKKMPTKKQINYLLTLNKNKISSSELNLYGLEEASMSIDYLKRRIQFE